MQDINEIFNNLKNDWNIDYAYLKACINQTDDLSMIHKIWDLAYEIADKDQKKIVDHEGFCSVDSMVERVERLIQNFDYVHAQVLLEAYIQKLSKYECGLYFDSIIDQELYFDLKSISKPVSKENVGLIYLLYGFVLKKQNQPARQIYLKGIEYSPMDFRLRFEYIETFKEDLDAYFSLSKDLLQLAYKPEQIYRIYRNLAYVFQAKKDLKRAQKYAYYGGLFNEKPKEVKADKRVVDGLCRLATKSEKEVALKCYQCLYDLIKNPEFLDQMDVLEGLNEQNLDVLYKDIMAYIKKKDEKSLFEHLKTTDVYLPFYQENEKVSPEFYEDYICVYTSVSANMRVVKVSIDKCMKLCEEFEDVKGIIINPYDRYQFVVKKEDANWIQ